jgi:hypothetical protein
MSNRDTIKCHVCNLEVEITEIINGANFDEHYLSCGHIQKVSRTTEQDYNLSQTCNICGLTARNKQELDEHVYNAHPSNEGRNRK